MACKFMDSFAGYLSSADFTAKWSSASNMATLGTDTRNGRLISYCARSGTNGQMIRVLDASATWYLGGWVYLPTVGSQIIFRLLDSSGNEQCSVRTDAGGHLIFSRNGTAVGSAGSTVLSANTWYHIELGVFIHDSTGTFEVRLGGVAEVGPTGSSDTKGQTESTASQISLSGSLSNAQIRYNDVTACDDSGSINNSFMGPVSILLSRPIGPGNHADWTPAGLVDNFVNVNSDRFVGDASFVQSATATQKDTYRMGGVGGTIKAVGVNHWARHDGSTRTIRAIARVGGTDYFGPNQVLSGSYVNHQTIFDASPATSSAWSTSEYNDDTEIGQELVS